MKKVNLLTYIPLIAIVVLASCKGKEAPVAVEEKAIQVKVQPAVIEEVDQVEEYKGTVEAFKQNNIGPSMPLRIDKIHVEVGDRVSAGELIATMDNTQYSQTLLQLEAQELDLMRIENLLKAGAVSQQDYDNIKAQVDITRKALNHLKQNMQLTSPMSGIVAERNYDDGDMYGAKPIATIMQMQPVKISINIPETYYPQVKKGMPVNIKLDTYGERIFSGSIYLIHPTIDNLTHSFTIEVTIPNNDLAVRPGMFARVELNFGKKSQVLIPDLAVQKQEGSNERYVFTIDNNTASRRVVQLGRRVGNKIEILSGVNAGEQVVVAGQSRLLDKSEVTIVENNE